MYTCIKLKECFNNPYSFSLRFHKCFTLNNIINIYILVHYVYVCSSNNINKQTNILSI